MSYLNFSKINISPSRPIPIPVSTSVFVLHRCSVKLCFAALMHKLHGHRHRYECDTSTREQQLLKK